MTKKTLPILWVSSSKKKRVIMQIASRVLDDKKATFLSNMPAMTE